MKKESVDQEAISALQECLRQVPFLRIEQIASLNAANKADFMVQVRIQGTLCQLLIATKNNGQPRVARLATYQIKNQLNKETNAYGIFMAPYISPESGRICEEAGIGYMDLAGNCLISFETVYIRQTGAGNPKVQKRELRSLYSPKGERILRILINDPKRTWRMAELAQTAEVSLGQVANIKKLLLDREWLRDSADGVLLTNPSALLDEWGTAYRFQRNVIREYYALAEILEIEEQLAETCRQTGVQYALTGFSSAARIAPMVRYQKANAYVKGDVESLIETLDWKVVPSGANVSVLTPYDNGVFFNSREVDEIIITSPIQTYLDLQSVRGRGQEAATAIRRELEKTW